MKLHPYLIFNGQAQKVSTFIQQGLEQSEVNTYDSPVPHSTEQKNWIMHAALNWKFGDAIRIENKLEKNPNIHLSLNYSDVDK